MPYLTQRIKMNPREILIRGPSIFVHEVDCTAQLFLINHKVVLFLGMPQSKKILLCSVGWGKIIACFDAPCDSLINCALFSKPDNSLEAVIAFKHLPLHLWDLKNQTIHAKHGVKVRTLCGYTHEGKKTVVVADELSNLHFYNLDEKFFFKKTDRPMPNDNISHIHYDQNKNSLIISTDQGHLFSYNISTHSYQKITIKHKNGITYCIPYQRCSDAAGMLLTIGQDEYMHLWEIDSDRRAITFKHRAQPTCCATGIVAGKRILFSADSSCYLYYWYEDGTAVGKWHKLHAMAKSMLFTPLGLYLALENGDVLLMHYKNMAHKYRLDTDGLDTLSIP